MPICFTDPEDKPILATTVYEDQDSKEEDKKDDDTKNCRVSSSESEGNLSTIPKWMVFGMDECGAIFSLPLVDNGAFMRVC
jgi:hypothetical protein